MQINKFIEAEVVIYIDEESEEDIRLQELGIYTREEEKKEDDKIVKYAFWLDNLLEIRQTLVYYNGEWLEAVVITCGNTETKKIWKTPALLIPYDEFLNKIGLKK